MTKEQLRRKGLLHDGAVRHVLGYGHIGDGEHLCSRHLPLIVYPHPLAGNLHVNIAVAAYTPEIESALEPFLYELVGESLDPTKATQANALLASHKGSISAEHGIGAMKPHAVHYSKSRVAIDMMRRIKQVFDPRCIMNPGKVLE